MGVLKLTLTELARLLTLLFATAPDAGQLRVALAAPTGKAAARLKAEIADSGSRAFTTDELLALRDDGRRRHPRVSR